MRCIRRVPTRLPPLGGGTAAVDLSGTVYVADTWNQTLRKITSGGVVTTLAGMPGSAGSVDGTNSAARFNWPAALAVDNSGNIYLSDYLNHTIRRVTPAGLVTALITERGVLEEASAWRA